MKILFALSLITLSSSAFAFAPGSECRLEGERKYVKVAQGVDDVYVCESGVWNYLYTRDAADNQD